ncbi:hypothetical protein [Phytomonospora endophytica]|uniref:Uncharacterized protein n=1 Tax=Phytomonospora endophytica TaxID=714109 RepID=A0A841FYU6_9ACTN|nr:hypothetical protein [Phytomonospora endophytica]MBB6037130.1 hypothetical protein [Phytomonospora endophytica]GIG71170.1 hypothetical protein Pen01_74650 [Phytomonospora endophytica]
MRTLTRAGLAAATAAVLALAPAGEALAAQGTFFYVGDNGEELNIDDPENGECYLLVSGARRAGNFTDTVAWVYAEHGCEGPVIMMTPGTMADFYDPIPHGVMFG